MWSAAAGVAGERTGSGAVVSCAAPGPRGSGRGSGRDDIAVGPVRPASWWRRTVPPPLPSDTPARTHGPHTPPPPTGRPRGQAPGHRARPCRAATDAHRDLPCEGGGKIGNDSPTTDPGFTTGLRLSKSGRLHFRRYEYGGSKEPDGYTDVRITVKGRTATGVVRRTSQYSNESGVHTCDSGVLKFTAERR